MLWNELEDYLQAHRRRGGTGQKFRQKPKEKFQTWSSMKEPAYEPQDSMERFTEILHVGGP